MFCIVGPIKTSSRLNVCSIKSVSCLLIKWLGNIVYIECTKSYVEILEAWNILFLIHLKFRYTFCICFAIFNPNIFIAVRQEVKTSDKLVVAHELEFANETIFVRSFMIFL